MWSYHRKFIVGLFFPVGPEEKPASPDGEHLQHRVPEILPLLLRSAHKAATWLRSRVQSPPYPPSPARVSSHSCYLAVQYCIKSPRFSLSCSSQFTAATWLYSRVQIPQVLSLLPRSAHTAATWLYSIEHSPPDLHSAAQVSSQLLPGCIVEYRVPHILSLLPSSAHTAATWLYSRESSLPDPPSSVQAADATVTWLYVQ